MWSGGRDESQKSIGSIFSFDPPVRSSVCVCRLRVSCVVCAVCAICMCVLCRVCRAFSVSIVCSMLCASRLCAMPVLTASSVWRRDVPYDADAALCARLRDCGQPIPSPRFRVRFTHIHLLVTHAHLLALITRTHVPHPHRHPTRTSTHLNSIFAQAERFGSQRRQLGDLRQHYWKVRYGTCVCLGVCGAVCYVWCVAWCVVWWMWYVCVWSVLWCGVWCVCRIERATQCHVGGIPSLSLASVVMYMAPVRPCVRS